MSKTWQGVIVVAYKSSPLRILLIENKSSGNITPIAGATNEETMESNLDAAVREVAEEASWEIMPDELQPTDIVHEFIYGAHKRNRAGDMAVNQVFLLDASHLPEPIETEDTRNPAWYKPEEALSRISFPDLKEVVAEAIDEYLR